MKIEDYNKYYIQGSDHYLIPKDDFIELFDEMNDWKKTTKNLKQQLDYIRSGEYYNQLRFEREMLEYIVKNGEVSKEDKQFIDMTHRNTELLEENQELKKQLEEKENIVCDWKDSCLENAGKIEILENQQKEFINYLEDKIYSIEPKGTGINYNCEYDGEEDYVMAMQEQSRLNTLKEILKKYKEIIGDVK